jgi:hypothetical protein
MNNLSLREDLIHRLGAFRYPWAGLFAVDLLRLHGALVADQLPGGAPW